MTDPSGPSTVLPSDLCPERIGEWTVMRLLGRGAMAGVWLCQSSVGQRAAVKWLDRVAPHTRHRFEREIRALGRVHHPNVVRVLGQGEWEGRPYAVMEHIDGPDLRVYTAKLKQRPAAERYREVARIGAELCAALEAVHQEGLVHRDVKPTNVLLSRQGRAVLADFGVVKDLEEPSATAVGVLIGTAGYAAPEQLRGEEVDHRADLYGLGATLYYMLTGDRPFPGRDARELERSHRCLPVPHPSALDPQVPPGLEAAVMRLLAKRPQDRFASARAARDALGLGPTETPAPLAGRTRYLEAASKSLDRINADGGRVLHLRGAQGSGRSWLLEMVEDMARRRGVSLVAARDAETLQATLKRLERREPLVLATRLPVTAPLGVPIDVVELEPLSIAELRRSLVSVAPGSADPHLLAERLLRACGGHAATFLALLAQHTRQGVLTLPDPIPPPASLVSTLDDLSFEALELLGAMSLLDQPSNAALLEQITQIPADEALAELEESGLCRRQAGLWMPMGDLVADLARRQLPDPSAVHRRAAAAFAALPGHEAQAQRHAMLAGDPYGSCPPAQGPGLAARLDEIEELGASGSYEQASEAAEQVLMMARASRQHEPEPRALRVQGVLLLDTGHPRLAEARFADAVALARALDLPSERRAAHILRAAATLDARPGSSTAAAVAMDRLHRALNTLGGPDTEGHRALGQALLAQAAALMGDRRSAQGALELAQQALPSLGELLRVRVLLRLAEATLTLALPQEAAAFVVDAETLASRHRWDGLLAQARALALRVPLPAPA